MLRSLAIALALLLPLSAHSLVCRQTHRSQPPASYDEKTLNRLYAKFMLLPREPGQFLRMGETETGFRRKLRMDWIQHSPYVEKLEIQKPHSEAPEHWTTTADPLYPLIKTENGYGHQSSQNQFAFEHFYSTLYQQYTNKIAPEMIQQLQSSGGGEIARSDYGMVRDAHVEGVVHAKPGKSRLEIYQDLLGKIVGTIRIFNGIPNRHLMNFSRGEKPLLVRVPPELPFEKLMAARKIYSKTAAFLAELRKTNPEAQIFEIGKFSVAKKHPFRSDIINSLWLFVMQHYLNKYPKGTFYAHVNTAAHLSLYQQKYGFKEVEAIGVGKNPITGEPKMEWILSATGAEIAAAIRPHYEGL